MIQTRNWTGEREKVVIQGMAAGMLLRAATILEAAHQTNLLVRYPPASKPGEFPHVRTGNLWRSMTHEPKDNVEVQKAGGVTVLYGPQAPYGDVLTASGRLGIQKTMDQVRPQISARLAVVDDLRSLYGHL